MQFIYIIIPTINGIINGHPVIITSMCDLNFYLFARKYGYEFTCYCIDTESLKIFEVE